MLFSNFSQYTQPHVQSSVLVTIDLQNDFVLPGAPAEGEGAMQAAAATAKMAELYRQLGLPIIHVVRVYSKDDLENVDACRRQAIEDDLQLVISGTEGMQPANGLLPEGVYADGELLRTGEPQRVSDCEQILYKPRWGCFHRTQLNAMLLKMRIDTVVVAGTWFANCVRTTIYEAGARDYRIVALRDAIAGIHAAGEADLNAIQCGVCDCAEWVEHVEATHLPR